MSGLEALYRDRIDFIHIEWDDPDSQVVLQYFGIFNRSTYLLLDPLGQVLFRWAGPLSEASVREQFDLALAGSQ